MKYKLICIDMDGTLLDSRYKVSEFSKSTLKKAHDMGVHIVVSTGRTYADAEAYSDLIGVRSPVIASNGAIVKEKMNSEVIYMNPIKEKLCMQLLRIFKKYNVKPTYSTPYKIYCSSLKTKIFVEYLKIKGIMNKSINLEFVVFWRQWFNIFRREEGNIIKCEIADNNQDKLENIRRDLSNIEGIEITSSSKNNIEIMKKGTSKGRAVQILSDHYKIKKEEIIAIGDSENDLLAIEFAGVGIAMGNANEEVKKKADFITDSNDNEGVGKAIEKFILCT